jgi:uncharacterized protein (DUF4415 family)
LAALPGGQIDTSDIPELPLSAWKEALRGRFRRPVKQAVCLRLDADIVAWLKKKGKGYQTRTNGILRQSMLCARGNGSVAIFQPRSTAASQSKDLQSWGMVSTAVRLDHALHVLIEGHQEGQKALDRKLPKLPASIFEMSGCRTPNNSAAFTCFSPRSFRMLSIFKTSCALTRCLSALGTPISLKHIAACSFDSPSRGIFNLGYRYTTPTRAVSWGITVIPIRFHFEERKSIQLRASPRKEIGFQEAQEVFSHPYYLDQRSDWREQYRAIGWVGDKLYAFILEMREDTREEQELDEEHS